MIEWVRDAETDSCGFWMIPYRGGPLDGQWAPKSLAKLAVPAATKKIVDGIITHIHLWPKGTYTYNEASGALVWEAGWLP